MKRIAISTFVLVALVAGLCACSAPSHTHAYGDGWEYNAEGHYRVCNADGCEATTELLPHGKDSAEVLREPKDGEVGVIRYTCLVCGYSFEEELLFTTSVSIDCVEGTEGAYTFDGTTLRFTALSEDSVYSVTEHCGEIS